MLQWSAETRHCCWWPGFIPPETSLNAADTYSGEHGYHILGLIAWLWNVFHYCPQKKLESSLQSLIDFISYYLYTTVIFTNHSFLRRTFSTWGQPKAPVRHFECFLPPPIDEVKRSSAFFSHVPIIFFWKIKCRWLYRRPGVDLSVWRVNIEACFLFQSPCLPEADEGAQFPNSQNMAVFCVLC